MSNNKNLKPKPNNNKSKPAAIKTMARKPVKTVKPVRKVTPRSKHNSPPGKPVNLSWLGWTLFIGGLIGLIFWQRERIDTFINQLFSGTAAVFGWGLLLVILGIIIAIAVFKREAVREFARKTTFIYWYRWLGAATLILAVWGLLALGGAGGSVGLALIGSDLGAGGWLRVIGLFALSFVLMAPAVAFASVKWLAGIVSRPFRVDKEPPQTESFRPYPPAATDGTRQPPLRRLR